MKRRLGRPCSHKELLQILHYEPETGAWTRLSNLGGRGWQRSKTGYSLPTGYLRIKIRGKYYLAHLLAWFYMTGKWPRRIVDHEDNDNTNCKWSNLRLATRRQNRVNSKCRSDNKSGFKGVHALKSGLFLAILRTKNGYKNLGRFDTAQQAHATYVVAAKKRYGEFARGA